MRNLRLISSAHAQTTPATAAPAQAPAPEAADDKDGQQPAKPVVVVSGFRSSLALSANEKRENVGLGDTVFSEDIGKFPDPNIADALARVPGVTVRRAEIDGEGLNISIRGMGAAFTRVLLNGAPMASASAGSWGGSISANREVDMDFLPSELFRSASVYKSQQASLIEGGIAGTVNMRSVRPFDKSGFRSAFTLSGNYREQNGKMGATGSGLVSNTWTSNAWGKFGLLGGVAFGDTKYKTDGFQSVDMRNFQLKPFQANASDKPNSTGGGSQSTPDTVPSGLALNSLPEYARSILVPGKQIDRAMLLALNPGATIQQIDNALMARLGRHLVYEGERKRIGEVLSMQWQPNDKWDVYLDLVAAQRRNKMTYQAMNAGTRANTVIPIGMEFDRSDCTVGCVLNKAIAQPMPRGLMRAIPFGKTIRLASNKAETGLAVTGEKLAASTPTTFKVKAMGLGRVALASGALYLAVDKKGGVSLQAGRPGGAHSFQWVETPTGELVLMSIANNRYLRVDPRTGEVAADSPGPLPDGSDGVRLIWSHAGANR